MSKILAKSGDSLADVYDVEGSIAGVEELLSKDVNLVHEMGGTIFSERLASRMIPIAAGGVAQSAAFNVNFSFTAAITRLTGLCVVTNAGSKVADVQVSVTSGPAVDNMDVPIFTWNAINGTRALAEILIAGSVSTLDVLLPQFGPILPQLLLPSASPRPANTISLRGNTTAFGGGTVTIQALIYVMFPQVAGLSSRGLPVPSW